MQFSTIFTALALAMTAAAAPGAAPSITSCSNDNKPVCCNEGSLADVLGLTCAVAALGGQCQGQSYCCETNAAQVRKPLLASPSSGSVKNSLLTSFPFPLPPSPGYRHQHQRAQLRQGRLSDPDRASPTHTPKHQKNLSPSQRQPQSRKPGIHTVLFSFQCPSQGRDYQTHG